MFTCFLAVLLVGVLEGPFADLTYEAALPKAKELEKLLFVDFTASWCGPCKKMDADTWRNAEVGSWLADHAIAIQVDVDKQKDLAQQFNVEAMPTVVVLRGGEEFDRVVGYKDAAGFLAWANDVAVGKRSSDELMERAKDLADSEDVDARYDLARDLLRAERYDLALEHYLWLWPATREAPRMGGVRVSFMLSDMADLARKCPPAKEAFMAIFDGLQAQVDGTGVPELPTWQEWSSFCRWFGEQQRLMAWYENHRDAEGRLFAVQAEEFMVQHIIGEVADVLVKNERPEDAARLFTDARASATGIVARFEEIRAMDMKLSDEVRESAEEAQEGILINQLITVYTAMLAADRDDEAVDVGALLVRTIDTPRSRTALVRAGLDVAEDPQESHRRWLDEAEAMGANVKLLRRKLERLAEDKAADGEE